MTFMGIYNDISQKMELFIDKLFTLTEIGSKIFGKADVI
jgi:hypothetical protein